MGKYIVVTPFFPSPDNWRGSYVLDQAAALRRVGMDVEVFMPSREKNPADFDFGGFTVRRFHVRETPSYLFYGFFNRYNSRSFLKAFASAGFSPADVEFVHCHTGAFGIYGLALKQLNPAIKVMLQHHDRDPYQICNGLLASWRPNLRYRARNSIKIFSGVDFHVCISEEVRQNLLRFPSCSPNEDFAPYTSKLSKAGGLKVKKDLRSITLYNGVDTTQFRRATAPHSLFTIGCIGNFQELKRHIDIIEALNLLKTRGSLPALKAIFIGSGPELQHCKDKVEQYGLSDVVEFRTEMRHEQLADFYRSLDLFVLPSVFEGFGCVYLEAAACGVPFICCQNQGACEYIIPDEADRWLAPKRNPEALAEMILRQYRDRATQSLALPIDIDILITQFLNKLRSL